MYLSRLILNPANRAVRRDLADCQQLHRTILSAFPQGKGEGGGARAAYSVLFRVDSDPRAGRIVLYVQSKEQPQWASLPDGFLLATDGDLPNPACKSVAEQHGDLQTGMVLRVRLRANPTRKIDTKTGPDGRRRHGKRVELRTEDEQIAWLRRKGEAAGFAPLAVTVNAAVPDIAVAAREKVGRARGLRRAGGGQAHALTFASVLYEGHVRITDAEKFRQALHDGIGPGKAYGFGLLSLAPPGG